MITYFNNYTMNEELKKEIIEILDNVSYWETCPRDYKDRIAAIIQQLNISGVRGSVALNETNNTTTVLTIGGISKDATMKKVGWYSDNFSTYYLDEDNVKHYR